MMDNLMKAITEDLIDSIEENAMDDSLEEAYCFLSGQKSSYETLDDVLQDNDV